MSSLGFSGYRLDGRRIAQLVMWTGTVPMPIPWGVGGPDSARRQPWDWGRDSDGTRHTAWAILNCACNSEVADLLHEDFARTVLQRMHAEAFFITMEAVHGWMMSWIATDGRLSPREQNGKEVPDVSAN